jgi:hypothetical protein
MRVCQTFSFMSIYFEESPVISEAYIYWIFLSDHGADVLFETSDFLLTTILPFPLPGNLTNAGDCALHGVRLGDDGVPAGGHHHVCRVGGLELPGQPLLLRHFSL